MKRQALRRVNLVPVVLPKGTPPEWTPVVRVVAN